MVMPTLMKESVYLISILSGRCRKKRILTDVILDPGRSAATVTFGFHPLEEVVGDLRAHTVGNENDLLPADLVRRLYVL